MDIVKTRVRVIYGDTDAMGNAYYANYLRWFELGRSEWFIACGESYRELERTGVFLPVVEAHCNYLKSAFYEDILTIAVSACFSGPARIRFDYEITRDQELLVTGYTVHVCVNSERKVLKPPQSLKKLIQTS